MIKSIVLRSIRVPETGDSDGRDDRYHQKEYDESFLFYFEAGGEKDDWLSYEIVLPSVSPVSGTLRFNEVMSLIRKQRQPQDRG